MVWAIRTISEKESPTAFLYVYPSKRNRFRFVAFTFIILPMWYSIWYSSFNHTVMNYASFRPCNN